MKKLLLSLTLLPLILCAAQPAKIYGPQELCYSLKPTLFVAHCQKSAANRSDHFFRASVRLESQCDATYTEIYRRFFDALMDDANPKPYCDSAGCGNRQKTITEMIEYYYFANHLNLNILKQPNRMSFDDKVCDAIKNSLILKLTIELEPEDTTTLDAQSIERLRTAWATPTDIFPKGRNPKNLILPKAPAPTAAAGSTDNKDHKSS